MNLLLWHVHGAWTTSFVSPARHRYLIPVTEGHGPDGRGRAATYDWPDCAVERSPGQLATDDIDVVLIQRPRDVELCQRWLGGRRLGHDVPAIWLEHNAPQGHVNCMAHPSADVAGISVVVHVSHSNDLLWDCNGITTRVVEHGVPDPGHRYRPHISRTAVVVNEPVRRGRVVGADLLPVFAERNGLDLFGIDTHLFPTADHDIRTHGDVAHDVLLDEVAQRQMYLHPFRWTSFGMALIEAMLLGMPVIAVASLEVGLVVPDEAGHVSSDVHSLCDALGRLAQDPRDARRRGEAARSFALHRFSMERFADQWDAILKEVTT